MAPDDQSVDYTFSLNDPYAPPSVRAPRMQILHKGLVIGGAISFTVNNNNYYNADTFSARFAMNVDPDHGMAFWGDEAWGSGNPILLDIQASMDGGQTFTSLIIGEVDHARVHVEKGLVEVEGRDLTANFIDTKTQFSYQNLTASQIVEKLAAKHNMTADVVPTSTLVGRYYEQDHERMGAGEFSRTTTEWNLMCSLAQKEQYDIWVTGTTVHFRPAAAQDPTPYVIFWDQITPSSNAVEITVDRSYSFAKDIIVAVKSWNSKNGRGFTKFAPSGARQASVASGKAQEFSYIFPNLTEADAQDFANRIRADLTKNERLFEFTVPGDLQLTARNRLLLRGTGTTWDQTYFCDSVVREMSFDGGFIQRVRGKNHSPITTVLTT